MTSLQPGRTAIVDMSDGETKAVYVTRVLDERQDEFRVRWDYNKDPVYVYDYEDNAEYPPDSPVVGVVFIENLERVMGENEWATVAVEDVREQIESGLLSEYHFPAPRLEPVE